MSGVHLADAERSHSWEKCYSKQWHVPVERSPRSLTDTSLPSARGSRGQTSSSLIVSEQTRPSGTAAGMDWPLTRITEMLLCRSVARYLQCVCVRCGRFKQPEVEYITQNMSNYYGWYSEYGYIINISRFNCIRPEISPELQWDSHVFCLVPYK